MTHAQDFRRWMPGWAVKEEHGRWLVAYRMSTVTGDLPGESVLFFKAAPRLWHAFYRDDPATGSGTTPHAALSGCLGDVVSSDSSLRAYRRGILAAPEHMARRFEGLFAAQSQVS